METEQISREVRSGICGQPPGDLAEDCPVRFFSIYISSYIYRRDFWTVLIGKFYIDNSRMVCGCEQFAYEVSIDPGSGETDRSGRSKKRKRQNGDGGEKHVRMDRSWDTGIFLELSE